MSVPLLQLIDIGFQNDQFTALEHINWEIERSNYYQIIGSNASGKTTLLSLMAGVHQPTSGTILWEGKPVVFHTPQEAYEHDIILMQEVPQLFLNCTVAENVISVVQTCKPGFSSKLLPRHNENRCRELFKELGINLDPGTLVVNLNPFQQRLVELAKIYYRGASLVLLDSFSCWCTTDEMAIIAHLLCAIHKKLNCAVIICTSNIHYIIPECTSILYLKSGRAVACTHKDQQDLFQVPADFRCAHLAYPKLDLVGEQVLLELKNFKLPVLSDSRYALPSDLILHDGEILGIYGMNLSHCQALCEIFTGQRMDYCGQIRVNNLSVRIQSPKHALRIGIACQPLLKSDALFKDLDLYMNMTPPVLVHNSAFRNLFPKYQRMIARYYAKQIRITPPDTEQRCRYFSNSNQQKMLLCRYLYQNAKVFILFNPTSGMDNQSKLDIYNLFTYFQQRGCGLILFSNDLDELAYMCDSIHVVHASNSWTIRGSSAQRADQLYRSILQLRR